MLHVRELERALTVVIFGKIMNDIFPYILILFTIFLYKIDNLHNFFS